MLCRPPAVKHFVYLRIKCQCMLPEPAHLPGRDMVGTLEYMAPEVLLKQPGSFASDVYAFGVTVNELASGVFPFSDCTRDNPKAHTILDMGYGRCVPPLILLMAAIHSSTSIMMAAAHDTNASETHRPRSHHRCHVYLCAGRSWPQQWSARVCGRCSLRGCPLLSRSCWTAAGLQTRMSGPPLCRLRRSCGTCRSLAVILHLQATSNRVALFH